MGVALSTAGVRVGYATGVLGTKPTTFAEIPDVKSTPDFNTEENGLDCTVLSETTAKNYVAGLKDYGSSVEFNVNLTERLISVWGGFCDAVAEAQSGESATGNECGWIAIKHPKLANAVVIPANPSKLGLPAMSVDSVMETSVRVTPLAGAEWVSATNVTITNDVG